jgi:antitoxin CptB
MAIWRSLARDRPRVNGELRPAQEQNVNNPVEQDVLMRRLKFRAWHRGTREADYTVGGFFERYHAEWSADDIAWFEAFMEEQDADIIGWALGTIPVPEQWKGPMMDRFLKLDFIEIKN